MKGINKSTGVDFQQGIEGYKKTEGAILIDVRGPEEYAGGHVPGSRNISLQEIVKLGEVITDKTTPLYVYCQSGARSKRAVMGLKKMGYEKVVDLGGIVSYKGEIER